MLKVIQNPVLQCVLNLLISAMFTETECFVWLTAVPVSFLHRKHSAEDEAVDLESLLDDTIVETTRRRRTYPRKILPHVVHSLKAERKLMVGVSSRASIQMCKEMDSSSQCLFSLTSSLSSLSIDSMQYEYTSKKSQCVY